MKVRMIALCADQLCFAQDRQAHRRPGRRAAASSPWTCRAALVALATVLLASCGTAPRKGGFYQDDGPPGEVPPDILSRPDAVPRIESFHPYANRPYSALGRRYVPMTEDRPFRARGQASWYGKQFHGSRTASGEIYDMFAMSAAHPTLPLPSYARVTHVKSGATVVVRVNDRGPFKHGRVIDLSYAAALKLGIVATGTGEVEVVRLTFDDIRAAQGMASAEAVLAAAPEPAQRPSTPLPATPLPSVGGPWSVQLGAFEVAGNAETLRERVAAMVEQAGQFDIAVHGARVESDGSMFRVLVGQLPDRESARVLADRLERLLGRATVLYLR
ncbi:MAG TPA: septal ring lytic transglycosylase RlpA family protein [Burkholderiaceae bacterium]|nr:septal ring lytic transglycosylase RlpA family protein [Burkholderiaceae bacterium]